VVNTEIMGIIYISNPARK